MIEDGKKNDKLCNLCKEFDRQMNGGIVSLDVFVECSHPKDSKEIKIKRGSL